MASPLKVFGNRPTVDRGDHDFYPTPPEVTQAVLDKLDELGVTIPRKIWEPACGKGDLRNRGKKSRFRLHFDFGVKMKGECEGNPLAITV